MRDSDFFHSPRQIEIFDVCRDKSRFSHILAMNRDYFSYMRTKFVHVLSFLDSMRQRTLVDIDGHKCKSSFQKNFSKFLVRGILDVCKLLSLFLYKNNSYNNYNIFYYHNIAIVGIMEKSTLLSAH